ncbi:hypothetical protein GC175_11610 [bacterium]|nr:hypothetical protein [bacterium]
MDHESVTLAQRLELLFDCISREDGKRYTYDDVRRIGGVDPSTISRLRSGQILDPAFSNIVGLAEAFGIPIDFFTLRATEAELRRYLTSLEEQHLNDLRAKQRRRIDTKSEILAHRAAYLDEEGIQAVVGMIDYVLRQKGVKLSDDSSKSSTVESTE